MSARKRLAAEERRQAILQAVVELFAAKGFDGVTTRELARAAHVSEALLYRHFPSKEALYRAVPDSLAADMVKGYDRVLALPPSSGTLVVLVQFMVSRLLTAPTPKLEAFDMLMVRSLQTDGGFARVMQRELLEPWTRLFRLSMDAARRAGDLEESLSSQDSGTLFAQSACTGLKLYLRHEETSDGGRPRAELRRRLARFILLGIGLKPKAFRRDYDESRLAALGAD